MSSRIAATAAILRRNTSNTITSTTTENDTAYTDGWRVDAKTSLFTYAAGEGPQTYVDATFPDREVVAAELPGREVAEALCRRRGVTDPEVLTGCLIDVALTGQADFATAAALGQAFQSGDLTIVRVAKAGDTGVVKFTGVARQKVFVDIPMTTMTSQCDALELHAPDRTVLKTGCMLNGRGYIDGTVLPVAGQYTITVKPREPSETRLRIITVTDKTGKLTPNVPPTQVVFDSPGVVGRLTFAATAGQRVYVDIASSTLPSQCGGIDLFGPDKRSLIGGCIVGGVGGIAEQDGYVIPENGHTQ